MITFCYYSFWNKRNHWSYHYMLLKAATWSARRALSLIQISCCDPWVLCNFKCHFVYEYESSLICMNLNSYRVIVRIFKNGYLYVHVCMSVRVCYIIIYIIIFKFRTISFLELLGSLHHFNLLIKSNLSILLRE